jgi:hypothetical protein
MPALYTVSFENVSISAAQDLVQVKLAAGAVAACRVKRLFLFCTDQTAPTTLQQLQMRARILPPTVSDGNGGAAIIGPWAPGASPAAASFTALRNSTSQATSTGTPVIVEECGMGLLQGFDNSGYSFEFGPGSSFVWELLGPPLAAQHFSGGVSLEQFA